MREILQTVIHLRPTCTLMDFPDVIVFEGDERENYSEIIEQLSVEE